MLKTAGERVESSKERKRIWNLESVLCSKKISDNYHSARCIYTYTYTYIYLYIFIFHNNNNKSTFNLDIEVFISVDQIIMIAIA